MTAIVIPEENREAFMAAVNQATEENIDAVIAACRQKALAMITESERTFVDSVVERGGLTTAQALKVLDDQRPEVLEQLDAKLCEIRAWLLRGGKDHH